MKCPQCGRELPDGSRFCTGCGLAQPKTPSRARKFFSALGHAICYYLLFFGIQSLVIAGYESALILSEALPALYGGYSGDFYDLYMRLLDAVYDRLRQNLHILLILSAALTILLLCIWFRARHKKPFAQMHIRRAAPAALPLALVLGAALQFVTAITLAFLPLPESLIDSFNQNADLMQGGPLLLELISVVIVTPLLEEIIFRGLVFSRLKRGMAAPLAVALSALIFGAAHGHIISLVYAGLLGVILACLMQRYNDSILPGVFCHAGFNGASYLLAMVDTESVPLLLAADAAALAVTVLCLYLLFRRPAAEAE